VTPTLPVYPPLLVMVLGTIIGAFVAVGGVYVQEHIDPAFRTPADVATELDIPLLAAIPQELDRFRATGTNGNGSNGHGSNGNGHGRGHGRDLGHADAPDSILPIGHPNGD